jgi:hypothetical protein
MRFVLLLSLMFTKVDYQRGIQQVTCFDPKSLVGLTNDLSVVVSDGGQWAAGPISDRALDLWRAPNGRLFMWSPGPAVQEVLKGNKAGPRWTLPSETTHLRLTFDQGVVAVTSTHLYRLNPGPKAQEIGPTPGMYPGFHSHSAPVLLGSGKDRVSCFATSAREEDDVRGMCIHPSYQYPMDFGDPLASRFTDLTPPFLCGDTVVSVSRGVTQARRLSTGARVGRAPVAALKGSGCVDDTHVMLVAKREVGVFELPRLRRTWRRAFPGKIAAAAVCDTNAVVVLETTPDPQIIPLPGAHLE